jgi:hypothetical protein
MPDGPWVLSRGGKVHDDDSFRPRTPKGGSKESGLFVEIPHRTHSNVVLSRGWGRLQASEPTRTAFASDGCFRLSQPCSQPL